MKMENWLEDIGRECIEEMARDEDKPRSIPENCPTWNSKNIEENS